MRAAPAGEAPRTAESAVWGAYGAPACGWRLRTCRGGCRCVHHGHEHLAMRVAQRTTPSTGGARRRCLCACAAPGSVRPALLHANRRRGCGTTWSRGRSAKTRGDRPGVPRGRRTGECRSWRRSARMPRDSLQHRPCRATQMRRGDAPRATAGRSGHGMAPQCSRHRLPQPRRVAALPGVRRMPCRSVRAGDHCAMNPPSAMISAPVT